jgi:hypothetical protein
MDFDCRRGEFFLFSMWTIVRRADDKLCKGAEGNLPAAWSPIGVIASQFGNARGLFEGGERRLAAASHLSACFRSTPIQNFY